VNRGRNLPVKVRTTLDGAPLAGPAHLDVWSCAARSSQPERRVAASSQTDAGRWMAGLDTRGLSVGCHTVTLVLDASGMAIGSFGLQVTDNAPAPAKAKANKPV
jgi:hypothetical protein